MTTDANPTTPATPPPLALESVPRGLSALQTWFQGPGRWVGWLVLPLVPLFIFSTAIGYELILEACRRGTEPTARGFSRRTIYDNGCIEGGGYAMALLSLFYVLLAIVFLASTYAILRRPASAFPSSERITRLQGVKDWFLRGDIPEDDYQRLRNLIEAQEDPKSLGTASRRAASFFRAAAILALPAGSFWLVFIFIFLDELPWNDDLIFIVNTIGGVLLFLGLFIAGLIRAARINRFGMEMAQSHRKQIDAAEEQVMRTARARAGHREGLPAASGASFRAYNKR